MDSIEHQLVVDTMKECDPDRVAYRLFGGVLVQRTVKEILPELEGNKESISNIMKALADNLKTSELNAARWQKKYNIRTPKELEAEKRQQRIQDTEGPSQGILA